MVLYISKCYLRTVKFYVFSSNTHNIYCIQSSLAFYLSRSNAWKFWTLFPHMFFLPFVCSVISSCPTLCDPMNHSPPDSSVHGILQARILEWIAISFSRENMKWVKWSRSVVSDSLRPQGLYIAYQAPLSMGFSRQGYLLSEVK